MCKHVKMCDQLGTPKIVPKFFVCSVESGSAEFCSVGFGSVYQHNNGTLESGRVFQKTNKVSHRPCFGQWANKRMRNHFFN